MTLLEDVPGHARFNVTYSDVLELPISLRDAMLEQLTEWRARENRK